MAEVPDAWDSADTGLNVNASEFVPSWMKPPADVSKDIAKLNIDDSKNSNISNVSETPASQNGDCEPMETETPSQPKKNNSAPNSGKRKFLRPNQNASKEHINLVFVGHVDAGKSTLGGQIMFQTGEVDKRTLEKYEREAREKNRESWYLSWALDTNTEEREKGKTVEVGRASFETSKKSFTILDAPGHKSFVPNMIGGAAQADVAILVISARRGEFETGFEKGGQTREHAMLVKTTGVKYLVVVINKMDEPTVMWDEMRYNECVEKLTPFLKKNGYNVKKDVHFMPISGLSGAFVKEIPNPNPFPSYKGRSLLDHLDSLPKIIRTEGPLRLPIVAKYRDMGTVVCGKIESGFCMKGRSDIVIMPTKQDVQILQLFNDKEETEEAYTGENIELKLKGIEEEEISIGFVICEKSNLCRVSQEFLAQIFVVEHKSLIAPGYSCVMHLHTAAEEVEFKNFICLIDRKTQEKSKTRPRFVKQDQLAEAHFIASRPVCIETFADFPSMGRFTLRDEGKTIAIGKVLKLKALKSEQ